ncbi:MAG TPA: glycosyltransferase family 9 protein [Acidobacteriota bacterium]|nr:glycosyltransferase family 9 protein [Acidobacteriota bacterium]
MRLIYHAGALGDFITTLPAITWWARRAGETEPTVLLSRGPHARLAVAAGLVDKAWDVDDQRSARLFSGEIQSQEISAALLFATPESPLVVTLQAGGCRSITRQDPFPSHPVSKMDYHLGLFEDAPRAEDLLEPLRRFARRQASLLSWTTFSAQGGLLLHPGSGGRSKIWPLERFVAVAEYFRHRGREIAWILGPAEEGWELPAGSPAYRNLPLERLCGLYAQARGYLGNDSGATHLAVACGCPGVVLFGPSDPRIWAPRGAPVRVVTSPAGDSIAGITADQVIDAIRDLSLQLQGDRRPSLFSDADPVNLEN